MARCLHANASTCNVVLPRKHQGALALHNLHYPHVTVYKQVWVHRSPRSKASFPQRMDDAGFSILVYTAKTASTCIFATPQLSASTIIFFLQAQDGGLMRPASARYDVSAMNADERIGLLQRVYGHGKRWGKLQQRFIIFCGSAMCFTRGKRLTQHAYHAPHAPHARHAACSYDACPMHVAVLPRGGPTVQHVQSSMIT